MLNIFSCACWPSVCLLWRNIYLDLLPIFGLDCLLLILNCMGCLYILEIKPLSVRPKGTYHHQLTDFLLSRMEVVERWLSLDWNLSRSRRFYPGTHGMGAAGTLEERRLQHWDLEIFLIFPGFQEPAGSACDSTQFLGVGSQICFLFKSFWLPKNVRISVRNSLWSCHWSSCQRTSIGCEQ